MAVAALSSGVALPSAAVAALPARAAATPVLLRMSLMRHMGQAFGEGERHLKTPHHKQSGVAQPEHTRETLRNINNVLA